MFTGFAESAFPSLVVANGFAKFLFPKIGPIGFTKIKFRIRALPKKVITQTDFSTGAYQQVGVRHEVGSQVL